MLHQLHQEQLMMLDIFRDTERDTVLIDKDFFTKSIVFIHSNW